VNPMFHLERPLTTQGSIPAAGIVIDKPLFEYGWDECEKLLKVNVCQPSPSKNSTNRTRFSGPSSQPSLLPRQCAPKAPAAALS
jgi:hypothetical protein